VTTLDLSGVVLNWMDQQKAWDRRCAYCMH